MTTKIEEMTSAQVLNAINENDARIRQLHRSLAEAREKRVKLVSLYSTVSKKEKNIKRISRYSPAVVPDSYRVGTPEDVAIFEYQPASVVLIRCQRPGCEKTRLIDTRNAYSARFCEDHGYSERQRRNRWREQRGLPPPDLRKTDG